MSRLGGGSIEDNTPGEWVVIDPHSPVWEFLVTEEEQPVTVAHTHHTYEYTRQTTYRLGSHTRTRTHRVISTFNPNHSNNTTPEEATS